MSQLIEVIGMGADGVAGLRPGSLERIRTADFLAGGERNLSHFPDAVGQRFVLKDNLIALLEELDHRAGSQRCVVLASGDPLFYGVGTYILRVLGRERVHIEPAMSSMQLAFAHAGLSWQDASLASIHGRDLRTALLPLLGRHKIGLFTQDGNSPAAVVEFFGRFELADHYQAWLGENLGTPEERITHTQTLADFRQQRYAPLNYLILHRKSFSAEPAEIQRHRSLVPGVPDDAFAHAPDDANFTRQEIRAVLLSKMAGLLRPGDTVWDIGAGLGTVSIEVAVLRPDVEVIAVEEDTDRARYLRQNRELFDAYNMRIVEGPAPAVLSIEYTSPRVIFLGGSGRNFMLILDEVEEKLRAGGRFLANFVTLENLANALQRFRAKGWRTDVTEVRIAHSDLLGMHTSMRPDRTIYIFAADKPGGAA
jgi:precorrin-6B C5,15-methyltransferase / cobalt-precorrin-6B C5,C15-methyltransferase